MSRLCGVGCWNCDLYGVVESCEVPGGVLWRRSVEEVLIK